MSTKTLGQTNITPTGVAWPWDYLAMKLLAHSFVLMLIPEDARSTRNFYKLFTSAPGDSVNLHGLLAVAPKYFRFAVIPMLIVEY